MKMTALTIMLLVSVVATNVCAFQESSMSVAHRRCVRPMSMGNILHESKLTDRNEGSLLARKSFLDELFLSSLAALPVMVTNPKNSQASGGATAGGAYLLSAKKRYYERVKTSILGLLQAENGLEKGDSKFAKEYFSSETNGSWKDLTAAGYLLSNAFRRSSSTAPDSLPAVKKYKSFAKAVDNFQKVLKKKGAAAASDEFPGVEFALNEWLSEIELPSAREL